jgi:hypothetical protein
MAATKNNVPPSSTLVMTVLVPLTSPSRKPCTLRSPRSFAEHRAYTPRTAFSENCPSETVRKRCQGGLGIEGFPRQRLLLEHFEQPGLVFVGRPSRLLHQLLVELLLAEGPQAGDRSGGIEIRTQRRFHPPEVAIQRRPPAS